MLTHDGRPEHPPVAIAYRETESPINDAEHAVVAEPYLSDTESDNESLDAEELVALALAIEQSMQGVALAGEPAAE